MSAAGWMLLVRKSCAGFDGCFAVGEIATMIQSVPISDNRHSWATMEELREHGQESLTGKESSQASAHFGKKVGALAFLAL